MRSRMCEWSDTKARDILGGGRRDVREIETVRKSFRWKEEELEHEESDTHCEALLEELGLCANSQTVTSAEV